MKPLRDPRWLALAVGVAAAVPFLPALWNGFVVLDDWTNFTANEDYRGLSPRHLKWMFTTFLMGHYQPLAWMTLGADYLVWGMNATGYHLTSLLLHATGAALLFAVLRALLLRCGAERPEGAAAAGALFWAIHPLRVESVAWATERRDVLCGVFFLLSLWAYLRMASEREQGGRWARWLALAVLAFAASLLSKALGIMLPFVLLVMDVFPLRRFRKGARLGVLLEKLPFLALAAADFAVMILAMGHIQQLRPGGPAPLDRLAQASFGVCFYLYKTFVPFNLSPLYPVGPGVDPSEARFVVCIVVAVLASIALLAFARRRPALLASWLAYGLLLAPVLGSVVRGPQLAADRYTYLSLMPLSALLAGALAASRLSKGALALAAGLAFGFLGVRTGTQCRVWKDEITLWNHVIDSGWGGAFAHTNRATERVNRMDMGGAIADLEQAIRHDDTYGLALLNRGKIRLAGGDPKAAEKDCSRAIECKVRAPDAHYFRGLAREKQGNLEGAMADYGESIRLHPELAAAQIARAKQRLRRGDVTGAMADFDEGLRRDPRDATAWGERGYAWFVRGEPRRALEDFGRSLEIDPAAAVVWQNRGSVRAGQKDFAGAIADLTRSLELDPSSAEALRFRGMAHQLKGDLRAAAADFERALEIGPPAWEGRGDAQARLEEIRKRVPK